MTIAAVNPATDATVKVRMAHNGNTQNAFCRVQVVSCGT